jgi:hypothetical protein
MAKHIGVWEMNFNTLISFALQAAVLAGHPHYHSHRYVVQSHHHHVTHAQPARKVPAPEKSREFDPSVAWNSK